MKKKLKICLVVIISCFGFMFNSCEKDSYNDTFQENQQTIIKNISLNEIYELNIDKELIGSIEELKKIQNLKGKLVYNSQFNFYIEDQKGIYYERDGVKSYTFQIFRENETDKIENIVFVLDKINQVEIFTTKYTLSSDQIEDLSQDRPIIANNLNNNVEISSLGLKNEACYTQEIVSIPASTNSQGQITSSFVYVHRIEIPCPNAASGGAGDTPSGNTNPFYGNNTSNTSTTSTGNGTTTSGGAGENNNNHYMPPPPIITSPIVVPISHEEMRLRNTFSKKLTPQQLSFFRSLTTLEQLDFYYFLTAFENPDGNDITEYSPAAISFAQSAIIRMLASPNFKIDLQKSYKSPAYIDTRSIDNNTPEGAKFNAVYNSLMTSPKFKEMFIDMFQNNSLYEVKFQIGNIPSGANGNTNTDLNNPTCNIITINPNYLNSANKIEIAKTILHEYIHAFLNIKLRHPNIGMQISNINNKDLACLINDNYNNFLDGNSHDFMADKLILTMVQILNEIKSTIFLPAQVHQAEDSGNSPMYQPYIYSPYGPSSTIVSWNWQNYFTYLCYIGLQTTTEFHILFPIPSSEYRFYSNYIARGDLIFNP